MIVIYQDHQDIEDQRESLDIREDLVLWVVRVERETGAE